MSPELKMVLLAAGRGSRLGELTEERPKALLPVRGRPLLGWLLDTIAQAGIVSPILVTGYRAAEFDDFGLETIHNPNWQTTNMVSSLLCAREVLRNHRTLISYTDILYSSDDLRRLAACEAPVSLAYDPAWRDLWSRRFPDPLCDAETFEINEDGSVLALGERPTSFGQVRGQYMGLLNIAPEGWRRIEEVLGVLDVGIVAKLDITSLLSRSICFHGMAVQGVPISSPWCEIDVPSDIPLAEEVLHRLRESKAI